MAVALSVPSPHQTQFYRSPCIIRKSWLQTQCSTTRIYYPVKLIAPLCSSSPTTAVDDDASPPSNVVPANSESILEDTQKIPLRGCKACGREEVERGCNGEGRIQGGIATIPGFGWWPIKAYRPCPGFVASGGRYRRQGQSMDEVAFGRGGRGTYEGTESELQSSTKKARAKEI
ncbi:Lin-54-like [Quillaja saponaria]|uniref:Lin-54-like n=1 Tax=Quillaja saponaria TaxID=32244 RepID=A0AAD7KSM8_QUISA|nr:Lin-54-like [Quillaja saponaria]